MFPRVEPGNYRRTARGGDRRDWRWHPECGSHPDRASLDAGAAGETRIRRAILNSTRCRPGLYTLELAAAGFAPVKRVQIDLPVGKILRIDIRMKVGGARQAVEVSAEGVVVDTSQSTVAANVASGTFDRLPKGLNFDSLIALAPGARYEAKGGGYQVDGASASETSLSSTA